MNYDVAVVGGGPGGYVAALYAAAEGLRVVLIEKDTVGGTCLNRGCIPTKAIIQSAHIMEQIQQAKKFGIAVEECAVQWDGVMKHKDAVVKKLTQGVSALLRARKVDVVHGTAILLDAGLLRVLDADGNKGTVSAEHIILACGSCAGRAPISGAELQDVVTSDGALAMQEKPEKLVIIGGGVIGLEMAYAYRMLGVQVTIIEMLPKLLPQWDTAVSDELMRIMRDMGIELHTSASVLEFVQAQGGIETVCVLQSGEQHRFFSNKVLLSTGRRPVAVPCEGVSLKTTAKGFVEVDEHLETNVKGIYAIGDMNGRCMLAHAASHQGICAVKHILGKDVPAEADLVPSCIYVSPNAASVGMTEQQARERFGDELRIGVFPMSASGMATACGENHGFVKVIADAHWGELLGVHIVAQNACELIAEATALISCEATAEQLTGIAHPHPSISETLMEAGFVLNGTAIHTIG